MPVPGIVYGIMAGVSIYQGLSARSDARRGGAAAAAAARQNAEDLRGLAIENAGAYRLAGDVNASAVLTVGEANALAIERATDRNMFLYDLQAKEDRRRHILGMKLTAGTIRSMPGAAGVQTNTGTPLQYLHGQVELGLAELRYGDLKAYWTLRSMFEEGEDKAAITRLTAEQQAMVIQTNAEISAQMGIANAEAQAAAMERSGQLLQIQANNAGSAAFLQGISNGIGFIGQGFQSGAFGGSQMKAFTFTPQPAGGYSGYGGGFQTLSAYGQPVY